MNKQGPSKFDGALANKAQGAGGPEQVQASQAAQKAQAAQAAQATQRADQVRQVETVNKTDKAGLNKVNGANSESLTARGAEPVNAKAEPQKGNMMTTMLDSLEKGQGNLEKLMKAGASGKQFSNAELLSLQASMYKYTQELDLTSKVVEKATSGLKDVVKTQV
ncbi:ATP-dependent helicase HrpB [Hyalangium rubrum]|uniref:ATP-dependent helicase HrpB n=1 Tax=Hyalangium rubrum TaxID=3103134 RepID=A0ABU5GXW5_9BACT|nr:ATP-dependent helicase HrpB [Hyalangium sp. s54d21]MDY7225539.1 ATP-dependent helicase HrpB [Hyalangium sp. s54d21]